MVLCRGLRLTESPMGGQYDLNSPRPQLAHALHGRMPILPRGIPGGRKCPDITEAARASAANRWSRPTASHHLTSGRGCRLALKVTIPN